MTLDKPARNGPRHVSVSTRSFLLALGRALLVLGIAALILALGYAGHIGGKLLENVEGKVHSTAAFEFVGEGLTIRMGNATESIDGSLLITGLSNSGSALATREVNLRALDYPFVSYRIRGSSPGQQISAVWLRSDNPGKVFAMPLTFNGDRAMAVALHEHPEWRGNIFGFGVNISGDLRGKFVEVSSLKLSPFSTHAYLQAVWSHWTSAKFWGHATINHMRSYTRDSFTTVAVALTLWLVAALVIIWALGIVSRPRHFGITATAVLLIPWIVFDLLWQQRLSHQLAETRFQFSGKTEHEKHLAEYDAEIYLYARELMDTALPQEPARIFILHNSSGHNLVRLKTQFYLLPHNMYNFNVTPPLVDYRPDDYILLLGYNPAVVLRPGTKQLVWGDNHALDVEAVHSHRMGNLYRVATDQHPAEVAIKNANGVSND